MQNFSDKSTAIGDARDLFSAGYNCSEATFIAIGGYLGIKVDGLSALATCFGGGMGRSDLICGAVSGSLMGIGAAINRVSPSDKEGKEKAYAMANKFITRFAKEKGSIYCSQLCKCNLSTPEGLKRFNDEDIHFRTCLNIVEYATDLVCDIILDKII